MILRKRKLLIYLAGLGLLILSWFGVSYYLSLRTLVVNYQNIGSVSVFNTKKLEDKGAENPIVKITATGQEIRLPKGDYTLQYDANENYEDLFVEINLNEKRQIVNLTPKYTEEYLDKLLSDEEVAKIDTSIRKKYPGVSRLYDIQRGKLYGGGEWYGTILIYKGDYTGANLFKTDALRIILKKENDIWAVKTNPPNILLNKYSYSDIPVDILRVVNTLPLSSQGE